ncbi:MAG: hypothetical protein MJ252_25240 [archaeon]|nr:hypothetical protein [archaeon]
MQGNYEYNFQNFDNTPKEYDVNNYSKKENSENTLDNYQNKKYSPKEDKLISNKAPKEEQKSLNQDIYNSSIDSVSTQKYQNDYLKKVRKMEGLIDIIKENAYSRYKKEVEEKIQLKNELENRVEILSAYLRTHRVQQKNFGIMTKGLDSENERLAFQSMKCEEEKYKLDGELQSLRKDINNMQSKLYRVNEETKMYKDQQLQVEREIMTIEDEIKRHNWTNKSNFSEKESIRSSIKLLKTHSARIKDKINKQKEDTDTLFYDLTTLAAETQITSEEFDKANIRYNKTSRSSTKDSLNKSIKKRADLLYD